MASLAPSACPSIPGAPAESVPGSSRLQIVASPGMVGSLSARERGRSDGASPGEKPNGSRAMASAWRVGSYHQNATREALTNSARARESRPKSGSTVSLSGRCSVTARSGRRIGRHVPSPGVSRGRAHGSPSSTPKAVEAARPLHGQPLHFHHATPSRPPQEIIVLDPMASLGRGSEGLVAMKGAKPRPHLDQRGLHPPHLEGAGARESAHQ